MPDFRQLSLVYQSQQDRLLLRVALEEREVLLWLTRGKCGELLQLLHVWSVGGSPSIAQVPPQYQQDALDIERQAALQKADFSAPYQAAPGQAQRPLLVGSVELVEQQAGGSTLRLTAQSGFNVTMALKPDVIHAFGKMLADAVDVAQWNLPLPGAPSNAAADAPAQAH